MATNPIPEMREPTPPPWEVRCVDGLYAVCGPTDWVATIAIDELCQVANMDSADVEVNRANAYFIATAPDMMAELVRLRDVVSDEDISSIDAIIAKARG